MLKDDDIVLDQKILFARHVDKKIGIALVEIIHGDARQALNGAKLAVFDSRTLECRMGEQDKNLLGSVHGLAQRNSSMRSRTGTRAPIRAHRRNDPTSLRCRNAVAGGGERKCSLAKTRSMPACAARCSKSDRPKS